MKDPKNLYNIDNSNYELVGVLDYYGSHVFKKGLTKHYMNSGVLLLNLDLIRETKLFEKARLECQNKKMIMPDQSALNKYCKKRLLVDRIYNEQHDLTKDTVFRHFSNTFKFVPVFKVQKIKPWHIDNLHNILNIYEIDDILEKYLDIKRRIIK
jgi:lipopolysaccharide biosynthesis glycosyltransferase